MRPIPLAVLTLVHEFEQGPQGGFAPTRYLDPAGKPTIGWGHLLNGSEDPLWDVTLDEGGADDLAIRDLSWAAEAVCTALGDAVNPLTDNQYAALIDFTYNEGAGNFTASTLCRMVKEGDLTDAADQFARWIYSEGVSLPGLIRRRAAEKALWLS